MSTPENEASTNAAGADSVQTSDRAKAIARRAFLRRSVGAAAPVVMTLQSGPALAVQSITCQAKTTIDNSIFDAPDHPKSGFQLDALLSPQPDPTDQTTTRDLIEGDTFEFAANNTGAVLPDGDLEDPTILDKEDSGSFVNRLNVDVNGFNDGFARCIAPADSSTLFTQIGATTRYTYTPGAGSLPTDPRQGSGALAVFTMDANGEDQFAACYGDSEYANALLDGARPLTNSCWSSLHPGATI